MIHDNHPELHVGFTGTRLGMTDLQKIAVREHFDNNKSIVYLHHGDCLGADAEAHLEAVYFGIKVIIHPPENSRHRAFCTNVAIVEITAPYLSRNHKIVDASTYLVATPQGFKEEFRSGTWATIRYARKQGKEVVIIYPDGMEVHDDR